MASLNSIGGIHYEIMFNGKEMWLPDIAKEIGVKYGLLYSRVVLKEMDIENAINDILTT